MFVWSRLRGKDSQSKRSVVFGVDLWVRLVGGPTKFFFWWGKVVSLIVGSGGGVDNSCGSGFPGVEGEVGSRESGVWRFPKLSTPEGDKRQNFTVEAKIYQFKI